MSASFPDREVIVCLANPSGFSGQKAATELLMSGLRSRGWTCRRIDQPVLAREAAGGTAYTRYAWEMLWAWGRATSLLFRPRASVVVCLGQTPAAFLRDGVPLLFARFTRRRSHLFITLHGSVFMLWRRTAWVTRGFRLILRQAGTIVALGDRQRARLLELGLRASDVQVVINTSDMPVLPAEELAAKLRSKTGSAAPIHCLFLSSLIDTKGYPEYLEALRLLSTREGRPIRAVLCGRMIASEFSDAKAGASWTEARIESMLDEIRRGGRVTIDWIRGAVGKRKIELFREADLFILPTRYAVEAQPLVLLEAMASGCAVLTSTIGEIPTILDGECARLMDPRITPAELASAIENLIEDDVLRARLASAGHRRYCDHYQCERHLDAWENLLARAAPDPRG